VYAGRHVGHTPQVCPYVERQVIGVGIAVGPENLKQLKSLTMPIGVIIFAQFISICSWLQWIHKDRFAPLAHAPFCMPWPENDTA
jgi:hypothetical protein